MEFLREGPRERPCVSTLSPSTVVICRPELVLVWGKETVCVSNPVKLSSGTFSPFRLQAPGGGCYIPFCDCSTAGCLWPQSGPKKPITAPFWIFPNISPTPPPRPAYSLCPTVQQGDYLARRLATVQQTSPIPHPAKRGFSASALSSSPCPFLQQQSTASSWFLTQLGVHLAVGKPEQWGGILGLMRGGGTLVAGQGCSVAGGGWALRPFLGFCSFHPSKPVMVHGLCNRS